MPDTEGRWDVSLSQGEAAALLSLIMGHHGNAQWDDMQLRAFHAELLPSLTVAEAQEAVRRFYASNASGRWMGSGDVNAIVRMMRGERKPSEAQIAREAENARLNEDQAWLYRRQRMRGVSPSEAAKIALEAPNPLALPPAKPKPKREGPGFNPNGLPSLKEVIGG